MPGEVEWALICADCSLVPAVLILWACVHEHLNWRAYCLEHGKPLAADGRRGLVGCSVCLNGEQSHMCRTVLLAEERRG